MNVDDEETYWQNSALQSVFSEHDTVLNGTVINTNIFDIRSSDDFWTWARGPFLNLVLRDSFADRTGFFNRYFRIVGIVQFRQLRVRNDSCSIPPELSAYVSSCYAEFSSAAEEVRPYGPQLGTWKWHTAQVLNAQSFTGATGIVYSGSGFNVTVPLQNAAASTLFKGMQDHAWIDLQTSAVFVDFAVVNANTQHFSLVKLVFEFPPASSIRPSAKLQTAPFGMMIPSEGTVSASEIWLLIQVCLLMILELVKAGSLRVDYARDPWVLLDWCLYCAYIAAFTYRLQPYSLVASVGWPPRPDAFVNYEAAFASLGQFRNVIALCSVLSWFKNFRYLRLVPYLDYLLRPAARAARQALAYALIFANCLWAFALAHVLVFGADVRDFSTAAGAMFALYRALLGEDRFEAMRAADQALGPLFYFGWSIVGTFFLTVRRGALWRPSRRGHVPLLFRQDPVRPGLIRRFHGRVAELKTASALYNFKIDIIS